MPLLPHQSVGAEWLAARRFALLADEMRVGKTPTAIAAADLIGAHRILVLCPAVARTNWLREFAAHSSVKRSSVAVFSRYDAAQAHAELTVCSYDLAGYLPNLKWDLLICDESHYLKSTEAGRSGNVLGKDGLIHHAAKTWFLSGTPTPNHPGELWPVLYVCGVVRLAYDAFIERYCTVRQTPFGQQVTGGRNLAELRTILEPFMLRRRFEDVFPELPPIEFSDYVVDALPVGDDVRLRYFKEYSLVTDQLFEELAAGERILRALAYRDCEDASLMLREQVKSLRRWVGLQKVPVVIDLVKAEMAAGEGKLVIFACHRAVVEELRRGLCDFGAVALTGATPGNRREMLVRTFAADPKVRVFIGQINACGVAIDLSAASDILMVEADWVPANNAQAVMRCRHMNQKNKVRVRFVGLAGSMDERIQQVLRRKTRVFTELFDKQDEPVDIFS